MSNAGLPEELLQVCEYEELLGTTADVVLIASLLELNCQHCVLKD